MRKYKNKEFILIYIISIPDEVILVKYGKRTKHLLYNSMSFKGEIQVISEVFLVKDIFVFKVILNSAKNWVSEKNERLKELGLN